MACSMPVWLFSVVVLAVAVDGQADNCAYSSVATIQAVFSQNGSNKTVTTSAAPNQQGHASLSAELVPGKGVVNVLAMNSTGSVIFQGSGTFFVGDSTSTIPSVVEVYMLPTCPAKSSQGTIVLALLSSSVSPGVVNIADTVQLLINFSYLNPSGTDTRTFQPTGTVRNSAGQTIANLIWTCSQTQSMCAAQFSVPSNASSAGNLTMSAMVCAQGTLTCTPPVTYTLPVAPMTQEAMKMLYYQNPVVQMVFTSPVIYNGGGMTTGTVFLYCGSGDLCSVWNSLTPVSGDPAQCAWNAVSGLAAAEKLVGNGTTLSRPFTITASLTTFAICTLTTIVQTTVGLQSTASQLIEFVSPTIVTGPAANGLVVIPVFLDPNSPTSVQFSARAGAFSIVLLTISCSGSCAPAGAAVNAVWTVNLANKSVTGNFRTDANGDVTVNATFLSGPAAGAISFVARVTNAANLSAQSSSFAWIGTGFRREAAVIGAGVSRRSDDSNSDQPMMKMVQIGGRMYAVIGSPGEVSQMSQAQIVLAAESVSTPLPPATSANPMLNSSSGTTAVVVVSPADSSDVKNKASRWVGGVDLTGREECLCSECVVLSVCLSSVCHSEQGR